jgi:hypothetical protein
MEFIMATFDQVDMREFYEIDEKQKNYLKQWESERVIKRCSCGKAYSFEHGELDPGECATCRGQEGELIY